MQGKLYYTLSLGSKGKWYCSRFFLGFFSLAHLADEKSLQHMTPKKMNMLT